jgi:SAM-dependent methyltransferase
MGRRCVRCLSTFLHRAAGAVVQRAGLGSDAAVYELSSRGALCRYLRRTFPRLTVSELFDDVPAGGFKNGVQCQDVQRLTYAAASFDLVTSTEVFEHVPDDAAAFREIRRVLRADGLLVFTVPLDVTAPTRERAVVRDGVLVHLVTPPEYHGDRLRGRGRVLAFRTYGLDILERLAAAGFEPSVVTVDDPAHAMHGARVVVGRARR